MADSQITKRVLAEGIKELMAKSALSKISVGDIAAKCGVNRQTFYYHFKDKYDLVNWIFYTETIQYIGFLTERESWAQGLELMCLYMRNNKRFYVNAMSTTGQNSFSEYLTQYLHDLTAHLLTSFVNSGLMTKAQHTIMTDYYTYGIVGMIKAWVMGGMKEEPGEFIGCIHDIAFPFRDRR